MSGSSNRSALPAQGADAGTVIVHLDRQARVVEVGAETNRPRVCVPDAVRNQFANEQTQVAAPLAVERRPAGDLIRELAGALGRTVSNREIQLDCFRRLPVHISATAREARPIPPRLTPLARRAVARSATSLAEEDHAVVSRVPGRLVVRFTGTNSLSRPTWCATQKEKDVNVMGTRLLSVSVTAALAACLLAASVEAAVACHRPLHGHPRRNVPGCGDRQISSRLAKHARSGAKPG